MVEVDVSLAHAFVFVNGMIMTKTSMVLSVIMMLFTVTFIPQLVPFVTEFIGSNGIGFARNLSVKSAVTN